MGATLTYSCPSCKGSHKLFLSNASMADALKKYRYVCPTTHQPINFVPTDSDWWKSVDAISPTITKFLTWSKRVCALTYRRCGPTPVFLVFSLLLSRTTSPRRLLASVVARIARLSDF